MAKDMTKIENVIRDLQSMDEIASGNSSVHKVHPLAKIIVTITYIGIVVSYEKYHVTGLVMMFLYPVMLFIISEVPFWESIKKLRIVLPVCLLLGIANPFFDQRYAIEIGSIVITTGMLSGLTLIIKAIMAVFASYLLIATTGIEKICYALRKSHFPDILVTQILLTYRYITVLLEEADHILMAYALRAPGQKGIHYKVWGTLVGQLFLRSIERADKIYESMLMRGFTGNFDYLPVKKFGNKDAFYLVLWIVFFLFLRVSGF